MTLKSVEQWMLIQNLSEPVIIRSQTVQVLMTNEKSLMHLLLVLFDPYNFKPIQGWFTVNPDLMLPNP